MFSKKQQNKVIDRYTSKFNEFGYSQKTLGWDKGKQDIRFDILTSLWDFENKSVLDIGCGFGDLYQFLNNKFNNIKYYHGIDLVPALVYEGEKRYAHNENFSIETANFLEWEADRAYDFIIISGIFNFKLENENTNYTFIKNILEKSFKIVDIGVSSNFLSNKVDYEYEHSFYADPAHILDFGYSLTRNLILRNDYFPFEFTLSLDKRDKFIVKNTIFETYTSQYE